MYYQDIITVVNCTEGLSNSILSNFAPRRRNYWVSWMWVTM